MKNILVVLVALVLVACCQRSEAWFQGGKDAMLANYPKTGTQCDMKARIAAKVVQDKLNGVSLSYDDVQTSYNFGALDPTVTAVLVTFALSYQGFNGYPNQAYKEVVSQCNKGRL